MIRVLRMFMLSLLVGCGASSAPPSATNSREPSAPAEPAWFQDITVEAGVDFVHRAEGAESFQMPTSMGSGVALLDYDQDGRLDLYFIQNGGPNSGARNQLYRQTAAGKFVDVSAGSGLDIESFGMGVAVGDVNNDGFCDLLITEYGGARLFLNQRDGTFREITREARVDNPLWGMSAAFCDYDRDGWLDFVIANYVDYDSRTECDDRGGKRDFCGPMSFKGTVSRLFRNQGAPSGEPVPVPRFEDATLSSGFGQLKAPGLGVLCVDLTGDHWVDFLVANDGAANHLWVNQRDGTFQEEAVVRGIAYNGMGRPLANMGIAVADVDQDGLLDIYITHLSNELHVCWRQHPAGQFQDVTGQWGLAKTDWRGTGFGTLFADFNQDGAVDLTLVNGRVRRDDGHTSPRDPARFWTAYDDRNQLLTSDGSGRFHDISRHNPDLCGGWAVSRGLATGDLDGDGALDLVVTRIGESARIFRNTAPNRGHWIALRAVDPALGGRDAYGAEITLVAADRKWNAQVNPGYSYLSSNSPAAHFGLGIVAEIQAVEILWPDGAREHFPGLPVDRSHLLRKGEGRAP